MRRVSINSAVFKTLTDEHPKQELKFLVDDEENINDARRKKITNEPRIKKTSIGYDAKIRKINR